MCMPKYCGDSVETDWAWADVAAAAAFAAGAADPEQLTGGVGVVVAGVVPVPPAQATIEAAKTSPVSSWSQVSKAPR